MKILFLTLINMENLDEHDIYKDLLREFTRQGHEVYVVCPREKRFGKRTFLDKSQNIQRLFVMTENITQSNYFIKGIGVIFLPWRYLLAINRYFKNIKFDLILYSTPPITLVSVVRRLKKKIGAATYLLLKDIWPQGIVDLGVIKSNGFIHKYFRKKEIELYKTSDYIGCMSQANVDYIVKHNRFLNTDKVEICPNSIEPLENKKNLNEARAIRNKYGIPLDKTVFIYGGNLGKPQGIDFLMKCIEINEEIKRAFILIAGSGTEFERIKTFILDKNFQNTKILSQIPRDDYEILVNTCDVGLIFLDHRFTIPNFPSRLLSYMQALMPVLAFTDKSTDIGRVIENGNFGLWAESGDLGAFQKNIHHLCVDDELCMTMGKNARVYLKNNYTVKHSYEIIMKHFI